MGMQVAVGAEVARADEPDVEFGYRTDDEETDGLPVPVDEAADDVIAVVALLLGLDGAAEDDRVILEERGVMVAFPETELGRTDELLLAEETGGKVSVGVEVELVPDTLPVDEDPDSVPFVGTEEL